LFKTNESNPNKKNGDNYNCIVWQKTLFFR
jgi:hypothetical protein